MKYLSLLFFFLTSLQGFGQEISIQLGDNEIGQNETFTVAIVAKNGNISSYDKFPDIEGFNKMNEERKER